MAKVRNRRKGSFRGKTIRNARRQQSGSQYGYLNLPKGVSVFKIEDAKTRIKLDIMPYEVKDPNHPDRDDEYEIATPGSLWYKRPFRLHRNVGPNKDAIVCPGKGCPICAHRQELMDQGTAWDDDAVKALKPSLRNLYVVIPKGHKQYPEEPHIWEISQFNFQSKLNEELDENEDFDVFPDLEEGYTLHIRFSEEQLGKNKFFDTSRIDFQPRKKPYDEDILESIPCLDEVLQILPISRIEALFYGGDVETEEEEETDESKETVRREMRRARRQAAPKIDDDVDRDDDEEDEDFDTDEGPEEDDIPFHDGETEEDEDEEDDENEPDETEDEEEEEEPKPQRRSTNKKTGECPHGHRFGKDHDEFDECDDCPLWEACLDASE